MASPSAGSGQNSPPSAPPPFSTPPPPSDSPPPTMSEEDTIRTPVHTTTEERGTKGKGKSSRRGKQIENMEFFDKVYNKKGKVQVFPDFVESKVTFYKRVTSARPPPPADAVEDHEAAWRQTNPNISTKSSEKHITTVATVSQHQREQSKATNTNEIFGGNFQEAEAASKTQFSSDQRSEGSAGEKDADSGQPKPKKIRIKEPPSFVFDEEKLGNPKIAEHLESEDCEFLVLQHTKAALEEITGSDDPPVIVLHNQDLSSKAAKRQTGEKDVLVLHSHLGVLLLEVKAVKNKDAYSRFDEATAQLLHAKESVLKMMGDLLEEDAVVMTIALPKLGPEDSAYIRQKAQERLPTKPASDVTSAMSIPSETSSSARSHDGDRKRKSKETAADRIPKLKEGALLGNHPEMYLLVGSISEVFSEWMGQLQEHRARASHAFKGSTDQERLLHFKLACMRCCSVAGLRPGQSVKDSADLHHRFLLTKEQLGVRDSEAELLHISGPCGSGKTLLLAERARRWLREGRRVALAVGNPLYNVLLRHLVWIVVGEKTDVTKVSTHSDCRDLLKWLDTASSEDAPVSIIVDEAVLSLNCYSRLLDHVTAGSVHGLWTAYTQSLQVEEGRMFQRLGGSTVQMSLSLRCPPKIMAWINSLRRENDPPLLPPPVPVTRELGVGVEVISHSDHPQTQPWKVCLSCREKVTAFFCSLGLLGNRADSALTLSDVVVITTMKCDTESVATWLRGLGLHAVADKEPWRYTTVPPPGAEPSSYDQAEGEARRQRILKGTDATGSPVIHVVWCDEFQGLEKPVVLLWHEDHRDVDRESQTQEAINSRKSLHRFLWFRAASRCQGHLLAMATTPSPLLSCVQPTVL